MTTNNKYRVTYLGFDEYTNYAPDKVTNVHTAMECDVAAATAQEAILGAMKAFGPKATENSGEWKVQMLRSPAEEVGAIGAPRDRSTLVTLIRGL